MSWESVTKNAVALTQKELAAKAIMLNQKIMDSDPRPQGFTRYVDGTKDAPEITVKAGGTIVYDYLRLDQVANFALDILRQLSPVDSGNYARSHVILLNGRVVDDLKGWKRGDTISISNPEPYTRKIEIGRKGYKARGHVYEKAERIVQRRYGGIATIFFTYRPAPPGGIHSWAKTTRMSHRGHASTNTRQEWLLRQPTLVIRE